MLQVVIWFILIQSSFSAFNFPYREIETVPKKPEPYLETNAPPGYKDYLGNLYAGQTEFPWMVDVSVPYLRQLDAVGNLLTNFHVLVTCRTIVNYEAWLPTKAGAQITYYEGARSIRISFASMYLNEEDRTAVVTTRIVANKRMIGTRIAAWTMLHPYCNRGREFAADFGIIGLSRPIEPMPPFVAFAPIWRSPLTARIPDDTDWIPLTNEKVCIVGAWGRNYSNVPKPMTLDHKVKIRAYAHPDLFECLEIWDLLCSSDSIADKDICDRVLPPFVENYPGLICMYTRSPVGAVCDSNKGAPVVCDSQIYGLVARAYPANLCSSLDPKPFIVVNMHGLETGHPPLFVGPLVSHNREGAAPRFKANDIILYTKNCGSEKVVVMGIPTLITIFLIEMSCSSETYLTVIASCMGVLFSHVKMKLTIS